MNLSSLLSRYVSKATLKGCLLIIPGLLTSCSYHSSQSDLSKIYSVAAKTNVVTRNPVIVIPGIYGSKLKDQVSGVKVWGAFAPGAINIRRADDQRLFSLPMQPGAPLSSLRDNVVEDGPLDRLKIRLIPGVSVSPKAYAPILKLLGVGGYADDALAESGAIDYGHDHYSCFQFSYDWRRSNSENAAKLAQFIESRRKYVTQKRREQGITKPVRFDIVAHSNGGLLTRYYLRYGSQPLPKKGLPNLTWDGAKNIDKVVLIGTPNLGATETMEVLTGGMKISPINPHYHAVLFGTMPSAYELLPRARHQPVIDPKLNVAVDHMDVKTWSKYQWGLLNPKFDSMLKNLLPEVESQQQRLSIATDHLEKCLNSASRFHQALDRPVKAPKHLKMVTWVGGSHETLVQINAEEGHPTVRLKDAGDGTVPRYSAIADNRGPHVKTGFINSTIDWDDINYLKLNHLNLTKDQIFSDNLLAFLLNQGGSVGENE